MKTLSNKQAVLALIQANPLLSQHELAQHLGISRSAVAGHVASLIRQGAILGRAYVLPNPTPVLCIGGANIDRKLSVLGEWQLATSNPVSEQVSVGGVARNIAENLARLGLPVSLLTALGDDAGAEQILNHCRQAGIDASASLRVAGAASGSYTAVLDRHGEMLVALAHMDLIDQLTPQFLQQRRLLWHSATMIVADLNLPLATVQELVDEAAKSRRQLILVAVSAPKMRNLPQGLDGVELLILNQDELLACVGALPAGADALQRASELLLARGVKRVIVTLGAAGIFYTEKGGSGSLAARPQSVTDVTGAGDAFSAGVCWSLQQAPDDLPLACQRGQQLAALTLQTSATVADSLHPDFFYEE